MLASNAPLAGDLRGFEVALADLATDRRLFQLRPRGDVLNPEQLVVYDGFDIGRL